MDPTKPTPGVPVAAAMPRVCITDNFYEISATEQQRNFQLSLQRARTQPKLSPKKPGRHKRKPLPISDKKKSSSSSASAPASDAEAERHCNQHLEIFKSRKHEKDFIDVYIASFKSKSRTIWEEKLTTFFHTCIQSNTSIFHWVTSKINTNDPFVDQKQLRQTWCLPKLGNRQRHMKNLLEGFQKELSPEGNQRTGTLGDGNRYNGKKVLKFGSAPTKQSCYQS